MVPFSFDKGANAPYQKLTNLGQGREIQFFGQLVIYLLLGYLHILYFYVISNNVLDNIHKVLKFVKLIIEFKDPCLL